MCSVHMLVLSSVCTPLLMASTHILFLITQCQFSGGIPIMVAALDSSGTLAAKAIDMLLSQSNEQLEATETVLVNLQAVPRLCKLLPPDIPGWTGDEEDEVQGKSLRSNLHSGVPCPALPCPALPCPALPCPVLSCPALSWSLWSCLLCISTT